MSASDSWGSLRMKALNSDSSAGPLKSCGPLTGLLGVYSRADDRVVLVVYTAVTDDEPSLTEEATELAIVEPAGIPWSQLAFWSTEQALRDHLATS